MSLKSGLLFSLFSGVSFADLYRSASRGTSGSASVRPSAAEIARATRFAGPAQISTGTPQLIAGADNDPAPLRKAA